PFQNWLKDARSLDKIASDSDFFAKKVWAKEIFGSHLLLGEKTVRPAAGGIPNSLGKSSQTVWAVLCAARLYPPKKQCASPKATLKISLEKWGKISGLRFAPPTIRSPKNRLVLFWCALVEDVRTFYENKIIDDIVIPR
ncbi:MAG: hypothetical protein ABH818_01650, partial [Patescibacteria group bacterium]